MTEDINERKERTAQVFTEQSELIDSNWDSEKTKIVPGDILLDLVCSKMDVRFKKVADGERLASLLKQEEIADDLRNTIKALAAFSS